MKKVKRVLKVRRESLGTGMAWISVVSSKTFWTNFDNNVTLEIGWKSILAGKKVRLIAEVIE